MNSQKRTDVYSSKERMLKESSLLCNLLDQCSQNTFSSTQTDFCIRKSFSSENGFAQLRNKYVTK